MDRQVKNWRRVIAAAMSAVAAGFVFSSRHAMAVSATWTGTTNNQWAAGTNWIGGTSPGSTTSSNTDTATFNGTGAGHANVVVDTNRFIETLIIDGATAPSYSIGFGQFTATSGGEILITSTVTTSQLISSNLIIGTIGGSYTLENDAASSSATVQFEGTIEGTNQASGSPTAATLYLSGSNNGSNIFDGPLSNNGVEKLNLVKIGGGTWTVYGQDTYTGTTVVSAGTLSLPFNFTPTGAITVNGGLLQLTGDITKASVTVGINGQMQIGGSGLMNSAGIAIQQGGILTIDNTSTNATNRLSNGPITISGGTWNYVGGAGGSSEQIGALSINTGLSSINLTPSGSGGTSITATSLIYASGGSLFLEGTNLGAAAGANVTNFAATAAGTGTAQLGGPGSSGNMNIGIEAFIVAQDQALAGNNQYGFVTGIGAAKGFRQLNLSTEYSSSIGDTSDGPYTLRNANLAAPNTVNAATTTVNSLRLDSGGAVNGTGTLTVNSGAILSLPGSGNITTANLALPNDGIITAIGNLSISSNIQGSGAFTKTGPGTLTLGASPMNYPGSTNINQGTLVLGVANQLPANSSLQVNNGTLDLNGFSQTITNFASTSATTNAASIINSNSNPQAVLTFLHPNNTATSNSTYSGTIGASGANNIALNFDLGGAVGLTLNQASTYSGATTITSGALELDFSQPSSPTSNILPATTSVSGALELGFIEGNGTYSQNLNGITVSPGSLGLLASGGTASSVIQINVGSISRNIGGTVLFNKQAGSGGFIASNSNTNGIIGGYAVLNENDWAVANGTGDMMTPTYTNDTWSAGANVTVTTNSTQTNATANSLRFSTSTTSTVTLSGTCVLTSGGILVGNSALAANDKISGGTLEGAAGADLIVNAWNLRGFEIDSVIADNSSATALTVGGNGTVILTGTNTYTGPTYVNGGNVTISSNANLGSQTVAAPLYLNDGALHITATMSLDNGGSNPRPINVGGNNGAFNIPANNTLTISGVVGGSAAALLNCGSTGSIVFSNANTYAGTLIVNNTVTMANANAAQNMTVVNNSAIHFATGNSNYNFGGLEGGSNGLGFVLEDTSNRPITLTVGSNNLSTTYSGDLGDGNLTKVGTGTLSLPNGLLLGSSLSSTNILGGTLQVGGGPAAEDDTPTQIAAGATLSTQCQFIGSFSISNSGLFKDTIVPFGTQTAETLTGLTMTSGGVTRLMQSPAGDRTVLVTSTLGFGGGTGAWQGLLDLSNSDMIVHNGNFVNILNQIAQGRNGGVGPWGGSNGIISSLAGENPNTTALAVELNTDGSSAHGGFGNPLLTSFDGQSVMQTDVIVKYTFVGDADLSGTITSADYTLIDSGFNSQSGSSPLSGWRNGDFNYDGAINGDDYTLIDNAFNTQGSVSFSGSSAGPAEMIATDTEQVAAVPEPGSSC